MRINTATVVTKCTMLTENYFKINPVAANTSLRHLGSYCSYCICNTGSMLKVKKLSITWLLMAALKYWNQWILMMSSGRLSESLEWFQTKWCKVIIYLFMCIQVHSKINLPLLFSIMSFISKVWLHSKLQFNMSNIFTLLCYIRFRSLLQSINWNVHVHNINAI